MDEIEAIKQSRSIRDDPYDLLIETICNVVSNHLTENDLRKLNVPITHHANVFLENVTRDIVYSNTLSTTPVIYQTHASGEEATTASITKTSNSENTVGCGSKRESRSEQNDSDEDGNDDDDSCHPPTSGLRLERLATKRRYGCNILRCSRHLSQCHH